MSGTLGLVLDARKTLRGGRPAISERQRARFVETVTYARTHSPYYQELWRGLPDHLDDPTVLPVTDKPRLMARFDDWVTDPAVTLEKAEAFADDPNLAGEPFLGKYLLTTTSGTTGRRGIFLMDDVNLAATAALSARAVGSMFTPRTIGRLLARGGRSAKIVATGGHFAAYAGERRQVRESPRRARMVRVLGVHTPIPQLVAQLNEFQPALVESYASVAALLAGEQEAGRLRIRPALVALTGEGLPAAEYARIASAFGAKVANTYGCNEAPSLGYGCDEGWLHVHSDWIVFEPVDVDHRPTPPGELSHTVLLSTLYKRAQPILRYDLGDSVLQRSDPCPCGNPLPAIRVHGRVADLLSFRPSRASRSRSRPLRWRPPSNGCVVSNSSSSYRTHRPACA